MIKPLTTILQFTLKHRLAFFISVLSGVLALSVLFLWHPSSKTLNPGSHISAPATASQTQAQHPLSALSERPSILVSSPRQLIAGPPVAPPTAQPLPQEAAPLAAATPSKHISGWLWFGLACLLLASWHGLQKLHLSTLLARLPRRRRQAEKNLTPKSPTDTQVLRHAYGELKDAFDKEEERMRQLVHLDALSRRLQRCASTSELAENVARCAQGVFPGSEGALFLHVEGEHFGLTLAWGDPTLVQTLNLLDCHALHSGQNYSAESPGPMACAHVHCEGPYVCLPLLAGSGLIGLLYLARLPQIGPRQMTPWAANAIAERAAIGLTALRRQEQWRLRAVRDGLTGLFNRGFMEESLGIELQRAQRQGSSVGIMLIDVDHFKRYNDSFGHAAGDALLRGFGKLLQGAVREGDMACRYGGEEFVLILPGADPTQTRLRAQSLCQAIGRWQPKADGVDLEPVTASFGVACYPDHGDTWQEVLKQADVALYQAKDAGRNQVCAAQAHAAQAALI